MATGCPCEQRQAKPGDDNDNDNDNDNVNVNDNVLKAAILHTLSLTFSLSRILTLPRFCYHNPSIQHLDRASPVIVQTRVSFGRSSCRHCLCANQSAHGGVKQHHCSAIITQYLHNPRQLHARSLAATALLLACSIASSRLVSLRSNLCPDIQYQALSIHSAAH